MDDNGGFDGGDFLTGALLALFLTQPSQARQAQQHQAAQQAQQAANEQAIVHGGQAAMRTAQQYGMTPHLHYQIAQAESVLRQWEQRRRDAAFAVRTKPIRSPGRWAGAVIFAVFMGLLGIFGWICLAAVLDLDDATVETFARWAGVASGVTWLGWAIHRHDAALAALSEWERRWLHHHGGPWHAHEYAVLKHHH